MSILGYSSAYFLPQYWANTPLYGEKIIPLLDYVLSTDYQHTSKLASAFYDIESKYKNTADLPIDKIEAIIEESGYGYIRNLLAQDEDSLRLLVYLLVLIHELKGSKKGIETVLELLRTKEDAMMLQIVGDVYVADPKNRDMAGFSTSSYITYSNFSVGVDPFDLSFTVVTSKTFGQDQCIASSPEYGFYLGINDEGKLVLRVGENKDGVRVWQEINKETTFTSTKSLLPDTRYTITFRFSGYDYTVDVLKEKEEVSEKYIAVDSSTGLNITGGRIALGLDVSTGINQYPYQDVISLSSFVMTASNVKVTQWFETFPVEIEDTFKVEADLDITLISEDFFVRFAKFVERYVYPTLRAFKVKMGMRAKVTFLPWVRQKVTYIASNIGNGGYENFNVLREDSTTDREMYGVQVPILYAWGYNNNLIYTSSTEVYPATILYNSDKTRYTGDEFKIEEVVSAGVVTYKITYNGFDTSRSTQDDIYGPTPFQTIEDTD